MSVRLGIVAFVALGLAACAGRPERAGGPRGDTPDPVREAALGGRGFDLQGRVLVADARDAGSASLKWHERRGSSELTLTAPVTGRSWRLRVDARGAHLDGGERGPRSDPDAQRLLARETGWDIPVDPLRRWVLGLPATRDARIELDDAGRPSRIDELGWRIDYERWDAAEPGLPRRITARRGERKVRLAVSEFRLHDP